MVGLDIARTVVVIAQRRPHLGNGAGQHPRGDVAVAPDPVQQLVARYQRARALQQGQQHRERLGLQLVGFTRANEHVARRVDFDIREAKVPPVAIVTT